MKRVDELQQRNSELEISLAHAQIELQKLRWQIAALLNEKHLPSSEKISFEQLELILDGGQACGGETAVEPAGPAGGSEPLAVEPKPKKQWRSKKIVIPDVIRVETIEIDPDCIQTCPVTGKPRYFVRWEVSEKVEFVNKHFKKVIIKRAVRAVKLDADDPLPDEPVVTAEMPAAYRVIPGCIAGIELLVYVLVSKYCDHLPLYRIESIFKTRHGVTIDRNLMGHWLKKIARHLEILYESLRIEMLREPYLQIDETMIPLLDPETKGRAKQAYFWVIKKPRGEVLFHFDAKRSLEVPLRLLAGMRGKLQSDGYAVYEALLKACPGSAVSVVALFICWAHARRKIRGALESNGANAAWYLNEIRKLYAVETTAREGGYSSAQREGLRTEKSRPILARIKARLDADQGNPAILPQSPLGKALNYIRERWQYLEAYAMDGNGEVEIDNNEVENAIRPTAIGKKNWLFIGHPKAGQMSATIYTIIENCRINGIDPFTYLTDVLPRIQDHPINRVSELLPRQWAAARSASEEKEAPAGKTTVPPFPAAAAP